MTLSASAKIGVQLKDKRFLYERFDHPNPIQWKIKNILNSEETLSNKLTDRLSDLGMLVWPNSFHMIEKIMFGTARVGESISFFSIRWSEDYNDIAISPLSIQVFKDTTMFDRFEFSADGKWVKTVSQDWCIQKQNDFITFLSINDSFPQSLSLPVYGGKSSRNAGGCFLETADWGTVYIDLSPDKPGYLIIYKMRDVMAKVVEKMSKVAK